MPLTDPIGEPLIEKLESLIPGLTPTKHSIVPGIKTNKPLLYPTPGEPENSEQLNLIETAQEPKSEFSRAEADALIINKANDINSIPEATTSAPKTNSYSRDATTSEIDPLIGKLDSDLGDPLTNPNRIISPVVTASTTSEKAAPKTPLSATAETSSKPEDQKTPLPSGAILKSDLEQNKTAPATVSPTDKSEPNKTAPATVSTIIPERSTNSSEKSDKIAVTNSTQTVAASPNIPSTDKTSTDKQSPVTKADDKIDSEKKSPTVDAIATEKPTSNSQQPTTQPATAPLIRATYNPVKPDVNIREEVNSTDSKNSVQTATQSLTDKPNDSGKVDPLKTESAAIQKTAASENVAVTTAIAAVKTPENSPNNTDSVSEIKQPVKTESIVSQSVGAELIKKTDTTAATTSISQSPAEADYAVTDGASQSPAETKSISVPFSEHSPVKIDSLVSNVREELPKEINSNVSTAAEELPTKNESIITAEINSGTVVLDIPVAKITGELETEELPTKIESIIAVPEAADTVEHNIPIAEITAELETEQFPTKTNSLAPAEFTAGTRELDITVAFTAAELATENPLEITVNSLESDSLTSNSNQHIQTDNSIPALFSNPLETTAGTAQIASVETSVSPSTLKSPPSQTSNNYNRNSTPTETATAQPAYSDTEIAPQGADITSGLLPLEAEKSALVSDNLADSQLNSTQGAGNFQSNINPQQIYQ